MFKVDREGVQDHEALCVTADWTDESRKTMEIG
jgi:hypothetical protein